jgi:Na+-translocating ferredoxin:NAD+ oxidoreductase subunit B
MSDKRSSRRNFLKGCARVAGAAAVVAMGSKLVARADSDKVWQLDAQTCNFCGRCATTCVRKQSAVRAVNDFTRCGYCYICPAYFDTSTDANPDGTFNKLVCPQNAMRRRLVGKPDPADPNNNYYEYTIDHSKCNGCGLCVKNCQPPSGNAALHLEVRHDLCRDCNQCSIAAACPPQAFYRAPLSAKPAGYRRGGASHRKGAKA